VNRWPTEETVLGLFFDVENPMEVGDTDPNREPGNRRAAFGPPVHPLQLWIDSRGTVPCPSASAAGSATRIRSFDQDREERDFRRSPVNLERDSDRLGHFSIVVRPSGRRRARCEASTAFIGGAGASRPVSFFGTAIGVWCPATTRCPSGWCAVSLPSISARRSSGRSRTDRGGCRTELVVRNAVVFGCSRRAAPRPTAREADRFERKDLEGEQSPGKDVMRLDRQRSRSSSGLGGGATPRSRRSAQVGFPRRSPATVDVRGSGPRDGERQGGNGHGDVVRLPARIPSRGVKRAARTACPPPTAIGSPMSGSGTG
jgi:hypothetical protein